MTKRRNADGVHGKRLLHRQTKASEGRICAWYDTRDELMATGSACWWSNSGHVRRSVSGTKSCSLGMWAVIGGMLWETKRKTITPSSPLNAAAPCATDIPHSIALNSPAQSDRATRPHRRRTRSCDQTDRPDGWIVPETAVSGQQTDPEESVVAPPLERARRMPRACRLLELQD